MQREQMIPQWFIQCVNRNDESIVSTAILELFMRLLEEQAIGKQKAANDE